MSERWVVLKGLLNSRDEHAMAAALAERRFLAEVEHPNIVKIHNFVEHQGDGYIVMEFVDGVSLKDMLRGRRRANGGRPDPLPVEQAIAFCLEILPALAHLHDLGLVFCDFKPDNVIQSRGAVKLIDLGGVYRMDDQSSPVYGTVGYQAPEIAADRARRSPPTCSPWPARSPCWRRTSPATRARTATRCRRPRRCRCTRRFPSLYAFLERATAADPDERFQSAEEMGAQLLGVLREIVAAGGSTPPRGAEHALHAAGARLARRARLAHAADAARQPGRPGRGRHRVAAGPRRGDPPARRAAGSGGRDRLWLARALIQRERVADALAVLDGVERADPWEWRATWYRGLAALAAADAGAARAASSGSTGPCPASSPRSWRWR